MFGVSFEHLLVVGVILLLVGPKRLPELGNTMGKAIKNFKDSFSGIEEASYKRLDGAKENAQEKERAAQARAAAADTPNQDAATLAKSENHPNPPPAPPA